MNYNFIKKIAVFIAISMGIFHLYTSAFGILEAYLQRSIHLGFVLLILYLTIPHSKNKKIANKSINIFFFQIIPFFLTIIIETYIIINHYDILIRAGSPTFLDLIIGALTIILVLEATRRVVGLAMVIIAIFALIYTCFGPWMPLIIAHGGWNIKSIIDQQFLGYSGIFGIPLGVMATYLIIFLLFGSFLKNIRVSDYYNNLAIFLVGKAIGGPAKAAVLASAFMGTISGSAVSNVATTGIITIPLMKKSGYSGVFAGAVEAVASSGGQFMPPIMGASAFIMAEYLGIRYLDVCMSAAIPAFFYFFSIFMMIHYYSLKKDLKIIAKDKILSKREIIKGLYNLFPIIILITFLVYGFTPLIAGVYGIISIIILGIFTKRLTINSFFRSLEQGAKSSVLVSVTGACAGIIICSLTSTGLGLRMSSIIEVISKGNLLITLFLIMITSIVLGMGVPTVGAYIILASVIAVKLVYMGVEPIAAHLFIFYFAIISAITPPVALAAYTGAGIAQSDPWKTGVMAFKMGIAAFLIPFYFVYHENKEI
ncbi:hypothetical protein ES708_19524 [subsurface metagenome]